MAGPADGHLRKGADEVGKQTSDGLLRLAGADAGAPAHRITPTGIVSGQALGTPALQGFVKPLAIPSAGTVGAPTVIGPQAIGPASIESQEDVSAVAVTMPLAPPAKPKPPPAWSSIGKPTPRRPRRGERERRLLTTTTRLRVECDSRVRATTTTVTTLPSHAGASVTVWAQGWQVTDLASTAKVRTVGTARSTLPSGANATVSRRDAPELEALLLGLL